MLLLGPDENSKELLALMNQPQISGQLDGANCVSIRIQSETESYTQFADICKYFEKIAVSGRSRSIIHFVFFP